MRVYFIWFVFGVCNLFSVFWCLAFGDCCLLFVVCRLLCLLPGMLTVSVCCLLFVLLGVVWGLLLSVVCGWLLCVGCCVVCRSFFVFG